MMESLKQVISIVSIFLITIVISGVSTAAERQGANDAIDLQFVQEARDLKVILEESSRKAQFEEPAPAGIHDGLVVWLSNGNGDIGPSIVKNISDKDLIHQNGALTEFIVLGPQNSKKIDESSKIISYEYGGIEQYSLTFGRVLEMRKGADVNSWDLPAANNVNLISVTTEDVFGLTDIYYNGQSMNTGGASFDRSPLTHGGKLTVGSFSTNTNILEFIHYNRALSDLERSYIESYIAVKYGMQPWSNRIVNPYGDVVWDGIENGNFVHDRGVIGRSDISKLSWTQAQSIDDSGEGISLVLAGKLPIVIDDYFQDESYVFIGSNGKPLRSEDISARRTWRIAANYADTEEIPYMDVTFSMFNTNTEDEAVLENSMLRVTQRPDGKGGRIYTPSSIVSDAVDGSLDEKETSAATGIDSGVTTIYEENATNVRKIDITFKNVRLQNRDYLRVEPVFQAEAEGNVKGHSSAAPTGPGGVQEQLKMWLRPESITADQNNNVEAWVDASAQGNDLTPHLPYAFGTAPKLVRQSLNFNNIVRFNKAHGPANMFTDYLGRESFQLAGEDQNYSIYAVVRRAETDRFEGIVSYASTADTNDLLIFDPSNLWIFKNGGQKITKLSADDGKAHIVGLRNTERVGSTDVYLDGKSSGLQFSSAGHQTGGAFVLGQEQDKIGGGFDPEQAFQGDIAEVILFHNALSDIDKLKVESYLAIKYGVTLPTMYLDSGGKVVWDPDKDNAFTHTVGGIGRDDVSGLYQMASKVGDIHVVYSDEKNVDDGDYTMWGSRKFLDDEGTGTDAGALNSWFFQVKGEAHKMDVMIDVRSMFDIGALKDTSFELQIAKDAQFTRDRASVSEGSRNGYTLMFENVEIQDGYYVRLVER